MYVQWLSLVVALHVTLIEFSHLHLCVIIAIFAVYFSYLLLCAVLPPFYWI